MKVKGQKPLPQTPVKKYIFALNKPKGYICANSVPDTQAAGRLVVDIFKVCCLDQQCNYPGQYHACNGTKAYQLATQVISGGLLYSGQ